jgi:hypothetical protein
MVALGLAPPHHSEKKPEKAAPKPKKKPKK